MYALEQTTAQHQLAALRLVVADTPGLNETARHFPVAIRHSCTDKYTSNIAAERMLCAELPEFDFLHTYCSVHRLYTCTKHSMSAADHDVSGILNLAMALGRSGCVAGLRRALAKVLSDQRPGRHQLKEKVVTEV